MAINTQRSLAELQKECLKLGLTVIQSGNRVSKTDYILKLREHYISVLYPNGIPKSLELMLELESPMLCSRLSEFTKEEQESIWESDDWIAEQKEDGCRMLSFYIGGAPDHYSRNISVKDYLPVNYTNNIYLKDVDYSKIKDQFVIDSELVCLNPNISTIMGNKGVVTETQLQAVSALIAMNSADSIAIQTSEDCPLSFRSFDLIWFNGVWIKDLPLYQRIPYLNKAIAQLQEAGINVRRPYSTYKNKKAFYKAMLALGAEGCILKNVYSPYIDSSSRKKDGYVKMKRTMSQAMQDGGVADGIDAFVSGYEPADANKSWAGYVGALEFSVYVKDEEGKIVPKKIARITNITMELREQLTDHDESGNPILKSEWYGKVGEVDGQCLSARSLRLKHAVLVQWRPDRSADTCIMDMDYIKSMVL